MLVRTIVPGEGGLSRVQLGGKKNSMELPHYLGTSIPILLRRAQQST